MSAPSQPLCIGMINICIPITRDITLNPDNSHLPSWIILWHNKHNIFVYLPNHQNTISSLPGTLSKTLIPFLWVPQTFMHCGPGGEWIENCQSNPTQTLFVEGVFMTDQKDPCSSQKPNLALLFFKWYPNILVIIESFQKQDFKLRMPKEYDCNTHSQCQLFTPNISCFKRHATLIYCSLFIDFQAKTDTITKWIRPPHDDPAQFHYSNPPPPSSKDRNSFSLGLRNPQWTISP
ncbi:hypothetical protein O181_020844 [Austropuccinia psidii MF-1]|uniref:Uncharacterized protein n=1 Tax=Austropuccinia psidii MF-1 TaxID=1389203 RepID=A0A9Q3CC20_9BASI|nr:hypothetical protein [Austropuccinia psidii MF-1]